MEMEEHFEMIPDLAEEVDVAVEPALEVVDVAEVVEGSEITEDEEDEEPPKELTEEEIKGEHCTHWGTACTLFRV